MPRKTDPGPDIIRVLINHVIGFNILAAIYFVCIFFEPSYTIIQQNHAPNGSLDLVVCHRLDFH
jgi:hypothetical protein